jgi:hypothetical protein
MARARAPRHFPPRGSAERALRPLPQAGLPGGRQPTVTPVVTHDRLEPRNSAIGAAGVWWPIRSSKPAGRCSPTVGRFDSFAAPLLQCRGHTADVNGAGPFGTESGSRLLLENQRPYGREGLISGRSATRRGSRRDACEAEQGPCGAPSEHDHGFSGQEAIAVVRRTAAPCSRTESSRRSARP